VRSLADVTERESSVSWCWKWRGHIPALEVGSGRESCDCLQGKAQGNLCCSVTAGHTRNTTCALVRLVALQGYVWIK
jgi:hypothetical protein